MINLTSVRIGFLSKTDWNVKPLLLPFHSLKQDSESRYFSFWLTRQSVRNILAPEFRGVVPVRVNTDSLADIMKDWSWTSFFLARERPGAFRK
jgi:hypothetical protein